MKKILFFMCLVFCYFICFDVVCADTVHETTKYYKIVNLVGNDSLVYGLRSYPYYEEITEQEYNEVDKESGYVVPLGYSDGYVETNYKRMTSSIRSNGSYYRYKVILDWKTIPSTRSYDIIGIGFPSSVKKYGDLYFVQNYCYSTGTCTSSTSHSEYSGNNGVGVSFQLPSGTLSSLKQTLYVDMTKNNNLNTITTQYAYGDYAHAVEIVSNVNSKYTVSTSGIVLNSSIIDSYDSISTARATWSGTW